MSRINTNVSSLIAQRVFRKNSDQLNQSLQRLSTGLKINTGADNAAGLADGATASVVVQVVTSAQTAKVGYSGGTITGATATIEVAGNAGAEQLSFASGTTVSNVVAAVLAVRQATGVSATVSGTDIRFESTEFGLDQFVSVKSIAGTFNLAINKASGANAAVTVNGPQAEADGKHISFRNSNLDVDFDLDASFNKPGTTTFGITGGGAT